MIFADAFLFRKSYGTPRKRRIEKTLLTFFVPCGIINPSYALAY